MRKSSPNHHKLAREFVLFDNFYVNADVSADGHNWSTSCHRARLRAEDVAEQLRAAAASMYDYEGGEPAALSARRVSLDKRRCGRASRMRNYGLVGDQHPDRPQPGTAQIADECAIRSSRKSRT